MVTRKFKLSSFCLRQEGEGFCLKIIRERCEWHVINPTNECQKTFNGKNGNIQAVNDVSLNVEKGIFMESSAILAQEKYISPSPEWT